MSTLGRTIRVKGELRAFEDITIEGHVDGPLFCENFAVVLGASAHVRGDVLARDITVFGRVNGQLIATDVVDVRADATVTGQVTSKRFILDQGAYFAGRVEPQHLEAAMRVAKFHQRKRDAAVGE
jgi:cytoskeletal protein CcmA (bactofilin family)